MALKTPQRQGGYTLIELIVAMGLAGGALIFLLGVYIQFQSAISVKKGYRSFIQKTHYLSQGLQRQITQCRGIISFSEEQFRLVRRAGDTLTYTFERDSLKIGRSYFPFGLNRFNLSATGPAYRVEDEYGFEVSASHPLAEFDGDDSGSLEFEELDMDGNGILEGRECMKIGLITIEMAFRYKGDTASYKISAHPRNHIHIPTEEEIFEFEM